MDGRAQRPGCCRRGAVGCTRLGERDPRAGDVVFLVTPRSTPQAVIALVLVAAPQAAALPQTQLVAADGAEGDRFGNAVALSGDTALVAARSADPGGHDSQGAVYVFTRDGGTWKHGAKLVAEDGNASDQFGWSVALSGDTALVGALLAEAGRGAAYVFVRDDGTWRQQAKLAARDGSKEDRFGWSVALSGDTALVGAALADVGDDPGRGAAYVFRRSGGTWRQRAKLLASDGAAGDRFGESVALSDDTALIGASFAVVGDNLEQGAAYVFTRDGDEGWSQQAKLVADDGAELDGLGGSVALSGDTALVGAEVADTGGKDEGAAYVFTRSGGAWRQQAKLAAGDGARGDAVGISVALSGDAALVGANVAALNGDARPGAAYLFTRSGKDWSQRATLTTEDEAKHDVLDIAVALSGATALLGAQGADVAGAVGQGAAYVFSHQATPRPP